MGGKALVMSDNALGMKGEYIHRSRKLISSFFTDVVSHTSAPAPMTQDRKPTDIVCSRVRMLFTDPLHQRLADHPLGAGSARAVKK
ncbi:hypothetical protein MPTK1_7g11770 [Marchantia polymorpha subsp. ruderalis]|uniref:Uncharacterized protein n=2 Tax=Marchantia polymorpha TaxID=3197 RepID=A0AAF6BYJ2_MARPO|nr:hypothetical protein MARPO_0003s0189 [Marchantia polymorpha]BBN17076.1 hypothetical protein Mp_7g11770 [Marchantia polymorpha subsp. ruderalis]|eukprot:PTQ49311.1 hypothetical protein MARPO_0003s0189 [Marchantia polymorpha]